MARGSGSRVLLLGFCRVRIQGFSFWGFAESGSWVFAFGVLLSQDPGFLLG